MDEDLAAAYLVLGDIKNHNDWDWAGADAAFQRALELEPGNSRVLRIVAELAFTLGRFEEAVVLNERALAIDPLSFAAYKNLGEAYFFAGRLHEAAVTFRKCLELNKEYPKAHHLLGRVYLVQSNPEAALTEMKRESVPVFRLFGLALAYHAAERQEEAETALAEFIEKYSHDAAFQIAQAYAYRGEIDRAFEWLERAYDQRDPGLTWIKGHPLLKNLEGDPRHTAFLKKMGLPVD